MLHSLLAAWRHWRSKRALVKAGLMTRDGAWELGRNWRGVTLPTPADAPSMCLGPLGWEATHLAPGRGGGGLCVRCNLYICARCLRSVPSQRDVLFVGTYDGVELVTCQACRQSDDRQIISGKQALIARRTDEARRLLDNLRK